MNNEISFLNEEELKNLDPKVLEEYLLTLESIDQGLEEYIETVKNNKDSGENHE